MKPLSRMRMTLLVSVPFAVGTLFGWAAPAFTAGLLGSSIFSDVPAGSYYDAPLGTLVEAGIIDRSTRYRPGDNVTRAEMAKIIGVLLQQLNGTYVPPSNTDVDVPSWMQDESSTSSRSRRSSSSSSKSSSSSSEDDNDDDEEFGEAGPEGALHFSTTVYSIPETAKGLTLGVIRSGGSQGAVSVKFELLSGTAKEGEDYYKNAGTLNFKDGETSKTFTILMKDDELGEGTESLTVRLTDPTGGAVLESPRITTVNIIDNEQANGSSTSSSSSASSTSATNPSAGTFGFSAVGYGVSEKGGTVTITVNRTGGSSGQAAVNFMTENSTAKSGVEYVNNSGTLTFADGETSKTFTVTIVDNGGIGGNKVFNVKLSTPTSGAGLSKAQSVVTIYDDEAAAYGSGSIKLSKSNYDGTEAGDTVITVQRVGGAQGIATVSYSTSAGTASGNDFTPANGTLTFLNGESTKEITVDILNDSLADSGETFYFSISSPTGATLGSPNTATVTIYE